MGNGSISLCGLLGLDLPWQDHPYVPCAPTIPTPFVCVSLYVLPHIVRHTLFCGKLWNYHIAPHQGREKQGQLIRQLDWRDAVIGSYLYAPRRVASANVFWGTFFWCGIQ